MIIAALVLFVSKQSWGLTVSHDTVYVYSTWQQMFEQSPEKLLIDPIIETISPYELEIYPSRKSESISKCVAVTLGDSIWLINSWYLKLHFNGEVDKLNGFLPLFFNEKVAYFLQGNLKVTMLDLLFGVVDEYAEDAEFEYNFYYIDFLNHKVSKVTPEVLTELLGEYHDLQLRYEGMKDYKKMKIIEDFFYKYIDRATSDLMRPYILDLVE